MNQKTFKLSLLSLSMLMLAACNTSESVTPAPTTPADENGMEMQQEAPAGKLKPDTKELGYSGLAQFVTQVQQIPCKDYAMDNEGCAKNPEGMVDYQWNFVQIAKANLNSELMSALDKQTEAMVKKEGDNYLINVGCKEGNQIKGSEYGTFENEMLNDAFENGTPHTVDFMIDIAPEGGDPACASLITKFNSVK